MQAVQATNAAYERALNLGYKMATLEGERVVKYPKDLATHKLNITSLIDKSSNSD